MSLLDFIFPKRCVGCRKFGSRICTDCFSQISFIDGGVCVVCQHHAINGLTHPVCGGKYTPDGVFSSLVYKSVVKKLIYKFKYKPHLIVLKSQMTDLFYEGLLEKEEFYNLLDKQVAFIPIPLHASRFRMRGYNQSELLAKELGKRFSVAVLSVLERVKNTKTQVGLKKEDREKNIKNAFRIKNNELGTRNYNAVFLVDDVATSGATLKEAAKVLKKAGFKKVYGLTLAHGE